MLLKSVSLILLILLSLSRAYAQETSVASVTPPELHVLTQTFTELYSETAIRPEFSSEVTQTRLRYMGSLPVQNLRAYIGVMIERDLNPNATAQFIENAVRPHAGLLYQPLPYLNLWADYGQRYPEYPSVDAGKSQSDPRAGVSTGSYSEFKGWYFESYGEAVWVPRLDTGTDFDGYLRPFVRQRVTSYFNADLYSEVFATSSPSAEFGPSYQQLRAGVRGSVRVSTLTASLFVYKPWALGNTDSMFSEVEGLLVIGGYF